MLSYYTQNNSQNAQFALPKFQKNLTKNDKVVSIKVCDFRFSLNKILN